MGYIMQKNKLKTTIICLMIIGMLSPSQLDAKQNIDIVSEDFNGSSSSVGRNYKETSKTDYNDNILIAKLKIKKSKGASGNNRGKALVVPYATGGSRRMELKRIVIYILKLQDAIKNFKTKYKAYPGDLSSAKASAFGFKVNGNGSSNKKGNHVIDSGEHEEVWDNLIEAKLIKRRPKADSGVGYSITNYSAYNITGNAILVGKMGSDGLYNAGALTPKEATDVYYSLKDYNKVIVNGEGREDCVVNGKYNTESKKKSCSLVVWVK